MKRPRLQWMVLFSFTTILYCSKNKFPEVTNWIGIELKNDGQVEKIFKTVGEGQGEITWWAGGYIYENGYFEIELIDLKTKNSILKKQYQYGDENTGEFDSPRFKWWHAEQKGKITLHSKRKYKMRIKGKNLAEPGCGWGMWLYKIGEKPRNYESPQR